MIEYIDPPLMASAFKLGFQPGIQNGKGQSRTNHAFTQAQDIGIVVGSRHPGHIIIGAQGRANAVHPVGEKAPNAWGLHDMLGNASEWCRDWHDPGSRTNWMLPAGPAKGTHRVARGGSFSDAPEACLPSARFVFTPDHRSVGLGFRVVMEARPVPGDGDALSGSSTDVFGVDYEFGSSPLPEK